MCGGEYSRAKLGRIDTGRVRMLWHRVGPMQVVLFIWSTGIPHFIALFLIAQMFTN